MAQSFDDPVHVTDLEVQITCPVPGSVPALMIVTDSTLTKCMMVTSITPHPIPIEQMRVILQSALDGFDDAVPVPNACMTRNRDAAK